MFLKIIMGSAFRNEFIQEEDLKIQTNQYISAYLFVFAILLLAACSSPNQEFVSTDQDVNVTMDEAPSLQNEDKFQVTPQIESNNVSSDAIDRSLPTPNSAATSLVESENIPPQAVKTEIQPSNPELLILDSGGLQFVEFFAFW